MPAGTLRPSPTCNSDEADVVGVGDDADGAAVVEGDIELARQLIHVARVGDVGLQRFGERSYIDKFVGIDTGDGRGRDVADVVCAGAARGHAERLNPIEHANDVFAAGTRGSADCCEW